MKILLVEDDEPIADVVKMGLEGAHYRVEVATDGEMGLEMAEEGAYSLLILDLMLPGRDGLSLCAALRSHRNQVPILMLTARDALEDRVRGLETGADDYLAKPFEFPELLARVRALLRRDKIHRARVIRVADLTIDTLTHFVMRAGQQIALTPREYTLLEAMAAHEGVPLSRERILEQVWMDDDSYSNTVDVCIAQLRKKVDAPYEPKLIQTVHRLGYMVKDTDGDTAFDEREIASRREA